jgi:hypothetical protein
MVEAPVLETMSSPAGKRSVARAVSGLTGTFAANCSECSTSEVVVCLADTEPTVSMA